MQCAKPYGERSWGMSGTDSQPRLRSEAGECYSKMTQERNTGARPYKVSPDKRGFGLSLRGPWGRFDDLKSAS